MAQGTYNEPARRALYVPEFGRVAHIYSYAWRWRDGSIQAFKSLCGATHRTGWRAAADSDPRCRRCAERGGEERERDEEREERRKRNVARAKFLLSLLEEGTDEDAALWAEVEAEMAAERYGDPSAD